MTGENAATPMAITDGLKTIFHELELGEYTVIFWLITVVFITCKVYMTAAIHHVLQMLLHYTNDQTAVL